MNKDDLAKELSSYMGWTQKKSRRFIDLFFDWIKDNLLAHTKVVLSGFGSFSYNFRKERRLLHPLTKQAYIVPERYCPQFTISPTLYKQINKGGSYD